VGVTRRKHRAESRYPAPAGPENCHGARRVRRGFCHLGTSFDRRYACCGTKLISETNLSRCNKCYKMGTGAVSRYKFDRSQKLVMVQNFNCGQMRVSGCKFWQDLSWEQSAAKTMTSPLIIPSVLAFRLDFSRLRCNL
jgi:hypothetical protein